MTTVLPTVTLARFDNHPRSSPSSQSDQRSLCPSIPIKLPASLSSLLSHHPSQIALTPAPSHVSSENAFPIIAQNTAQSENIVASVPLQTDEPAKSTTEDSQHSLSHLHVPQDRHRLRVRPNGPVSILKGANSTPRGQGRNVTRRQEGQKDVTRQSRDRHDNCSSENLGGVGNGSVEKFPALALNETQTNDDSPSRHELKHSRVAELTTHRHGLEHRPRSSNASSRLVHTIKTASLSNYSLSIIPRSLGFGSFGYSQGHFGSQARHSLDSERPDTSSCLLDEPALMRGVKRRQIVNELIMTEESYVADLKALVYLYSTLLVSANSISDNLRLAIQRNVTSLLHVHETLLEKFHQAAFKAAARKWADTKSPTRLKQSYKSQGRLWTKSQGGDERPHHRRAASSVGSAELNKTCIVLGTAEPVDVLDLTVAFDFIIEELFVYEEYCANHEIISRELQKHMPSLWSTYESGIESLNRALIALSRRKHQDRKGLTVGDLLIKPVQRICKYPLLLEDLLRQTPVIDGPAVHEALQSVLDRFRNVVQAVNIATDNHFTRAQIQRKWLLQDRINLDDASLPKDFFRVVGSVQLCGVLFLTYQTPTNKVEGSYVVCMLFDNLLLITTPNILSTKLDVCAMIALSDLRIESATRGKGLQSPSALYTWKVCFAAESNLHEVLLSACSKLEEDQWVDGLRGGFRPAHFLQIATHSDQSRVLKDMKCVGSSFRPYLPLSRQPSIQRAATVGNRDNTCQVILRNTHNAQDLHEYRHGLSLNVGRSRSHATAHKVVVLAPKRAERTRLEASLSDIYTKDRLPFPGMIGSKGSQIFRASAGSLARKLSLASMQATFSRRSTSLSSRKSNDTVHTIRKGPPTFTIRKQSLDDQALSRQGRPKELPELDTMDSVIERMINGGSRPGTAKKRMSFSGGEKLVRKNTRTSHRSRRASSSGVGPEDLAMTFYQDNGRIEAIEREMSACVDKKRDMEIQDSLTGTKRRQWSSPIAKLRGLGSEGLRNILYSAK